MLECVVNVSEGRRAEVVSAVARPAGTCLLDVHSDPFHHRSVLTLAGPDPGELEEAVRAVAAEAVRRIDLRTHQGAHPRLGALDVVPFVALAGSDPGQARAARDRFASWAGERLALPCFLYGPERSLPQVRREAFRSLVPDAGPPQPHPTAGAACVGARGVLVAYNVWLAPEHDGAVARDVAAAVRRPTLRALGLELDGRAQVSMNLVDPERLGPAQAYDLVAERVGVDRAELVGLLPAAVLAAVPPHRWAELDLDSSRTIEARLGERDPSRH